MKDKITNAIESYISQLTRGEVTPPPIAPPAHQGSSGLIHCSRLGGCQKKHALERIGREYDHPWLAPENNVLTQYLFVQSTRAAWLVQEALVTEFPDARTEVRLESTLLSGYVDVLLPDGPVEIKRTDSDKYAQPVSDEHVWQLIGYLELLDAARGCLVYLHRYTWRVYEVVRGSDSYLLEGKHFASHEDFVDTIRGHTYYQLHPDAPARFSDPTQYWGCLKNKKGRGAARTAVPRCPWFSSCWGIEIKDENTRLRIKDLEAAGPDSRRRAV